MGQVRLFMLCEGEHTYMSVNVAKPDDILQSVIMH